MQWYSKAAISEFSSGYVLIPIKSGWGRISGRLNSWTCTALLASMAACVGGYRAWTARTVS